MGRGRSDRGRVWPAVAVALVVALVMPAPAVAGRGLARPRKKEVAQILVSTAENSSRDWRAQYRYIEYNVEHNAEENRGYTGGIIGFTSRTGDMLAVVRRYCRTDPGNLLAPYLPALIKVNGTLSREGLGPEFVRAWRRSAEDPGFRRAQDHFRDAWYFTPAVRRARRDGVHALGQFAYYDASVMHGHNGMLLVRRIAVRHAATPAQGGGEQRYLEAFLAARIRVMRRQEAHHNVTRVTTCQRRFLRDHNLRLRLPLRWAVYGDRYHLTGPELTAYLHTGHFPPAMSDPVLQG